MSPQDCSLPHPTQSFLEPTAQVAHDSVNEGTRARLIRYLGCFKLLKCFIAQLRFMSQMAACSFSFERYILAYGHVDTKATNAITKMIYVKEDVAEYWGW